MFLSLHHNQKPKTMGKYINETSKGRMKTSFESKCNSLLLDGAEEIHKPIARVRNLVCVVDNKYFGAAAYIHNDREYMAFTREIDLRPKRWFIYLNVEKYSE
jgi:hypothetical protein